MVDLMMPEPKIGDMILDVTGSPMWEIAHVYDRALNGGWRVCDSSGIWTTIMWHETEAVRGWVAT